MSLREICHCGHDRLSHAHVRQVGQAGVTRGDCLAMGCDCKGYVNEFDPPPKKRLIRPLHHHDCQCPRCREFAAQVTGTERKTDPWGPDFSGP